MVAVVITVVLCFPLLWIIAGKYDQYDCKYDRDAILMTVKTNTSWSRFRFLELDLKRCMLVIDPFKF